MSVLQMLAGTVLMAASFGMLIIPLGFAAGGVTGFSRIVGSVLPLPLPVLVFIFNMLLLVSGLIFVGWVFAAKTVTVSVLFPVLLDVFSAYPLHTLESDPFLAAVLAGVMLGIGAGLVLRSGASSGGFDILAVILNNKFKIPVAAVMNICDCAVILMQAMGQPLTLTLYGILVITVSSACVSRVVTLGAGESQVLIFSEHHDEIRTALLHTLDVGMTSLEAESGFEQKRMKVIVSVIPYRKFAEMKQIITEIDPTAFVVVDQIHSVLGKGYTLDKHFNAAKAA